MSQIGEGAVVNYPVPRPLRVGRGVQAKLKQRGGGDSVVPEISKKIKKLVPCTTTFLQIKKNNKNPGFKTRSSPAQLKFGAPAECENSSGIRLRSSTSLIFAPDTNYQ